MEKFMRAIEKVTKIYSV